MLVRYFPDDPVMQVEDVELRNWFIDRMVKVSRANLRESVSDPSRMGSESCGGSFGLRPMEL